MTVKVDMKALFESGAHFGHKTSRWHPKMAPYIHSKRQEAHIINLEKTVEGLEKALPFAQPNLSNQHPEQTGKSTVRLNPLFRGQLIQQIVFQISRLSNHMVTPLLIILYLRVVL